MYARGVLRLNRFHRAQRVVARDHQDHVRRVERVLRGEQQSLRVRRNSVCAEGEDRALVLEPELLGPRGQRGVRLRTADENDVAAAQQLVVDFEVLVDRDAALVLVLVIGLQLLGGVAVRAGLAIRAVYDDGRAEAAADVGGQVGGAVARVGELEAGRRPFPGTMPR